MVNRKTGVERRVFFATLYIFGQNPRFWFARRRPEAAQRGGTGVRPARTVFQDVEPVRELATRVTRAYTRRKEAGRQSCRAGRSINDDPWRGCSPFLRRVVKHAAPVKGVICNWTVFRAGDQSATSLG